MVSQQWLNESIILNTRPDGQPGYIWEHQLDIIVPNEVKDRSAIFLHATNGNNPPNLDNPTPGDTKNTVKLAENLGIISGRYSRLVELMLLAMAYATHGGIFNFGKSCFMASSKPTSRNNSAWSPW